MIPPRTEREWPGPTPPRRQLQVDRAVELPAPRGAAASNPAATQLGQATRNRHVARRRRRPAATARCRRDICAMTRSSGGCTSSRSGRRTPTAGRVRSARGRRRSARRPARSGRARRAAASSIGLWSRSRRSSPGAATLAMLLGELCCAWSGMCPGWRGSGVSARHISAV